MEITALNTLFNWIGIVASIFVVISVAGTYFTGKAIAIQNDREVSGLKTQVMTLSPRTISEEQRTLLVKKLSTSKGLNVGFVTKVFDSESENYATQLSKIFNEASWNVIYPINKTLLDDFNGSINIFAQHGLIANADLVCVILSEVGIRCERQPLRDGVVSGVFDQNTIYLIIGSRVIK